jgi:hypothetical protein
MAHDVNRVDDEIKRQLYTQQIKWWIKQAEEEIIALKGSRRFDRNQRFSIYLLIDETKLLQFAKDPLPQTNNTRATSTNKLPMNGPFTIVTTKDRLYNDVIGGGGYPR